MNLQKLFEMQKVLDDHIINEHPELKNQNNLEWKILALQVELGECANEWRGFKKWSIRQTPRMYPLETCDYCGEEVEYTRPTPFMGDASASMCKYCWNSTKEEYAASNGEYIPTFEDYPHFPKKKPIKLLEEFVDCLHFILSIGLELGIIAIQEKNLNLVDERLNNITIMFHQIYACASNLYWSKHYGIPSMFDYIELFQCFIKLGEMLGFTWDQIEQAYFAKNAVNHQRQKDGY